MFTAFQSVLSDGTGLVMASYLIHPALGVQYPQYFGQSLSDLKLYMNLRRKPDTAYLRGLMQTVGLEPDDHTRAGKYSLGMKQRLGIAMALMDEPGFLILDEPMNGLDSQGLPKSEDCCFP